MNKRILTQGTRHKKVNTKQIQMLKTSHMKLLQNTANALQVFM